MTIRKTFQWTIVLVAIIAAGGWYAVKYAFEHKDRLVLDGLRRQINEKVPDWGVTIGDARFDLRGRVMLTDVVLRPDPKQPPLVTIPRCLATLDSDLLINQKEVLIRSVRIINPQVVVSRNTEGLWNWQQLSRPASSNQTPAITIEQGDLFVQLAAGDGLPQTDIASRDINLRLVPAGHRRYRIEGASQMEGLGALLFDGEVDINSGAWRLAGRADQIEMSQDLLEKAAAISPDVGRRVAELSGGGETLTPGAAPEVTGRPTDENFIPVQTVAIAEPSPAGQLQLPQLGLSASVGVDFDILRRADAESIDYRVVAKVVDGTVTEPLSPVPLNNLQGEVLLENGRVVVQGLSATGGASHLSVSGTIEQIDGRTVRDFEIAASKLLIDDELRHLLPTGAQRLFDRVNPAGLFTIRGRFRGDGVGSPQVRLDEFTAIDCSMRHELFPYPVTGITGTVKQEDDSLILNLTGFASQRRIGITGTVTNPGPEASATVDVVVDGLPLDQQFLDSLVAPKHQQARAAIIALGMTGRMDVRARFVRPAGLQQPTAMGLDVDVRHGTINFKKFPYRLSNFTGHVHFNPWKEPIWHFTKMHGQHGDADLTGEATFDTRPPGGRLELTTTARNVLVDEHLLRATTTAQPSLHEVWVELNPSAGVLQLEDVQIDWTPGQTPTIELPSIHLDEGVVELPSFPYRLTQLTGDAAWKDGRITLQKAAAIHGRTELRIDGRSAAAQFHLAPPEDEALWRLRLEDVKVRRLTPDADFKRALPGDVAAVVTQLNPRGPIDADLRFELAAFPNPRGGPEIVTSDWHLVTRIANDQLSVGLDLKDVTGFIEADIAWNGYEPTAKGTLEFEAAKVLDMTLTNIRGPFSVEGYEVIVGSSDMLQPPQPGVPEPQVPIDNQLSAAVYGGSISLNAGARLDPIDSEQTTYQTRVRFKDADLRQWAQEWKFAGSGINGTAHGGLNLEGRGTSELGLRGNDCWMTITDARLGELPVVARMLTQVVAPQQRDNTAFRYAYLEFDIRDGVFDFGPPRGRDRNDTRRIQLVGDSLKMIGQGYVPFAPQRDPRMSLEFYSKADQRNPILAIPIVGPLARSMSDNWIHVQVTGLPADPRIRTQTEVPIDNALREFFRGFDNGLVPRLR